MQKGKNCFMINTEDVLDSFLEYEKNNKLFAKKIGDLHFGHILEWMFTISFLI